jgi:hypothetical protein
MISPNHTAAPVSSSLQSRRGRHSVFHILPAMPSPIEGEGSCGLATSIDDLLLS